jgi:hypothetical protein
MTAGTSYFRAYAPATDRDSAQVTAARAVKVRAGAATLRAVPAAVGQSKAGRVDLIPFEASFAPARAGRPVLVQRRGKAGWQTVGRTTQDARGRAVVLVRRSPPGTSYRAVAPAYRGATAVSSPTVAQKAWKVTFSDDFDLGYLDPSKWAYRQLDVNP